MTPSERRCDQCAYWEGPPEWSSHDGGTCELFGSQDGHPDHPDHDGTMPVAADASGYAASFCVPPDFHCKHWSKVDDANAD